VSDVERAIEEASRAPLLDAAYSLWMRKMVLDREDHPVRVPNPRPDLKDPEVFGKTVRDALAKVHNDRAMAHEGSTFDRLKRAHPEATDLATRDAIKAAVKFDVDCSKYFSYRSHRYTDDVTRAIELAKKDNPGFQEQTYKSAWHHLATAMR
jgi:hypothetical protein